VAELRAAIERRGRESVALLTSLFESAEYIITATNVAGLFTSWNLAAERVLGYKVNEILGQPFSLLVLPADIEELKAGHDATVHEGISTYFTKQLICKDGTLVDVAATRSAVRDAEGAIIGVSRIGRDITQQLATARERKVLERRVNQIERMESLGQLAGGVAHDFNNLLFVISGYTGFVQGKLVDMPEASAHLEKIEIATRQASALTRRLLTFARREIVEPRSVALNDQIADLAEFLGQTLGENIELAIRPLATHDNVIADPGQIEQVLLNVVLNSRDAMPDGGKVTIETKDFEIAASGASVYPTLSEGRYVLLEITDTGSGMDSSILEHIFEPFFTTKPLGEGTGLGMSTAFGVIGQAGGDIHFYSELGVGTTCRILLPLSDQVAPIESASHDVSAQGRGETILVVEDVVAIRELIHGMLTSNGYNVIVSASSPEAIAFLETYEGVIDLLLTDVIMPEKSGRAVADAFKSIRPYAPVIFISGYADPVALADLNYAHTLLQKPFSENNLLVTIRNILDLASLVDSEPDQPVVGEVLGGESACFAHLLCPECGSVLDETHTVPCPLNPVATQPNDDDLLKRGTR
jgi:PAS domain S-box-containing protein